MQTASNIKKKKKYIKLQYIVLYIISHLFIITALGCNHLPIYSSHFHVTFKWFTENMFTWNIAAIWYAQYILQQIIPLKYDVDVRYLLIQVQYPHGYNVKIKNNNMHKLTDQQESNSWNVSNYANITSAHIKVSVDEYYSLQCIIWAIIFEIENVLDIKCGKSNNNTIILSVQCKMQDLLWKYVWKYMKLLSFF